MARLIQYSQTLSPNTKPLLLIWVVIELFYPRLVQSSHLKTTPWIRCVDLPTFECRNITVPRFYESLPEIRQGNPNGTLVNQERRITKGVPAKYVWLIEGGPSANSDFFATIAAPQISKALGNNFVIQIPSERGSQHTKTFTDYPEYPQQFDNFLANQNIPIQAYTSENIVHDIMNSVHEEMESHPAAKHYAVGLSFGTYLLGRILQSEPALFHTSIFDGSIPQNGPSKGIQRAVSLGLVDLASALAMNCDKSTSCRSWSLDSLISFVDQLSTNITTPCFNAFTSALKLNGSADQIYDNIAFTFTNSITSPSVIPFEFLRGQPLDIPKVINTSLGYYQGEREVSEKAFVLDYRVLIWVLTNHFAQCNAHSEPVFQRLLSSFFVPALTVTTEVFKALQSSLIKVNQITKDHITFSEADFPSWTAEIQKAVQANSLIRQSDSSLQINDQARAAHAPYLSKAVSTPIRCPAIAGNVILLGGRLDANTPYFLTEGFFNDVRVSSGWTKLLFTFNNAAHEITIGGWTACMPYFWKGYLVENEEAKLAFATCLDAENAAPLDWGFSTLTKSLGIDVWEGLKKN